MWPTTFTIWYGSGPRSGLAVFHLLASHLTAVTDTRSFMHEYFHNHSLSFLCGAFVHVFYIELAKLFTTQTCCKWLLLDWWLTHVHEELYNLRFGNQCIQNCPMRVRISLHLWESKQKCQTKVKGKTAHYRGCLFLEIKRQNIHLTESTVKILNC